ncbi:hypothetical protein V6N11_017490 [Hibiscus sabdariffa]|uniref:RNase H type-1 domain-containing protein n=1 Tax=Hibiscus sabdariffa TaxID=183260 RepID=A0ABR2TY88_9ROSI
MALISWNVRGLGQKDTIRSLKVMNANFNPCIIFLSETKQKKPFLERIRKRLKFDSSFYIDPLGISGGLALWWKSDSNISILSSDKNCIHTSISCAGEPPWLCSFIYGPPKREEKQEFWYHLASLRSYSSCKWCIIGDSNIVASQDEKLGGLPYDLAQANWFLNFLDECQLMELPIKGGSFSWSNKQCEENNILEKLDRIMFSSEWSDYFPRATGIFEVAIGSDHSPLILLTCGFRKKWKKDFKFESRWLIEDECKDNVHSAWSDSTREPNQSPLVGKLNKTKARVLESPIEVWHYAEEAFCEFSNSILRPEISPTPRVIQTKSWSPPPPGVVKVNCDASFDASSGVAAAAAIIRDCSGCIVRGATKSFTASSASVAESLAARLGLSIAIDASFSNVFMETDNADLASRLNAKSFSSWETASIDRDIVNLASSFSSCQFSFVRRECNCAADWIAKAVRLERCPQDWISVIPEGLRPLL